MPDRLLGPDGLLEYNATYRVLICRTCRYAIQKSAVPSHLLRHKIYRNDRTQLLASISQLDIAEPEDVTPPSPSSPPSTYLPVISGLRCMSEGCESLCASTKRMRRHWSVEHGVRDAPPNITSLARTANLQTFFRGNKLRYFEVAQPERSGSAHQFPEADANNSEEEEEEQSSDVTPQLSFGRKPVAHGDLETLSYFHHFITVASLTLPTAPGSMLPGHYWQTIVVQRALQDTGLIAGVLAISASHLGLLADDTDTSHRHYGKAMGFLEQIKVDASSTEASPKAKRRSGTTPDENGTYEATRTHILFIMECICSAKSSSPLDFIAITFHQYVKFLGPGHNIVEDERASEGMFAETQKILEQPDTDMPPFDYLRVLPYRMAEAFGAPDNAQDVVATLSSLGTLVECCKISFASNDAQAAWRGMATWLARTTGHFEQMMMRGNDPAALVLLAHWAGVLVRRAEQCGVWFVKGLADAVLADIQKRLPQDNSVVHALVANLIR